MPDQAELDNLLTEMTEVLGETVGTASSSGRSFGGWKGMYSPMAPSHGWGGIPIQPERGAPAWPYRTESAHAVWAVLKRMIPLYPEKSIRELLKLAVDDSGVPGTDLTPEDWRMLEMAAEYHRDGTLYVKRPRIGGAPGGPADHHHQGHLLKKRGAP